MGLVVLDEELKSGFFDTFPKVGYFKQELEKVDSNSFVRGK